MIAKIVALFLVFIAVLGMFGKLRLPRIGKDKLSSARCKACGRYTFGKSCDCKDRS